MNILKTGTMIVVTTFALSGCNLLAKQTTQSVGPDAQSDGLNQPSSAENDSVLASDSSFVDYSPTALAEATKADGKAVLFFHANWCPTCRSAERDITSNLSQIPENVTILKTNYDSERELKKKYNVTYQHTFVQVDADGNQVTKWSGGGLDEILGQIQ